MPTDEKKLYIQRLFSFSTLKFHWINKSCINIKYIIFPWRNSQLKAWAYQSTAGLSSTYPHIEMKDYPANIQEDMWTNFESPKKLYIQRRFFFSTLKFHWINKSCINIKYFIFPWRNSPIRTWAYQSTAGLTSTYPQIEMKDYPANIQKDVYTHLESPRLSWLSKLGYLCKSGYQNFSRCHPILTPWLMEPGGSMPHYQGLSNNSYPELNQPNSSYASHTLTKKSSATGIEIAPHPVV